MDVFVSYATPDRDRVRPIVEALEKEGWSVWWDRNLEAGSTFDREIESVLDSAKCVLVVWTQHSIESDWVLAEAGEGLERGILVPLLLESVRPPLAFRRAHAVMREDVIEAVTRQILGASTRDRLNFLTLVSANDAMSESVASRAQRIAGTFRGRLEMSNGTLVFQFPSAIAAVRAGLELRTKLKDAVALGISSEESTSDEHPDLTALAAPGEICLTDGVFQEVRRRLELAPQDLGKQSVDGASDPVHVFRIGAATPRIVARAARVPKAQPHDIPTLAVMSFRNMNADPDFEYFGDGIAVDVVEELLRIPRLHVVSTMSSFTYKNSSASAMEIGRELDVAHVLEGTVRRVGSQVRIATQLAKTSDGQVEWAEHFDRRIDDVFEIQDEITREITLAMDVKFYKGENARVEYQLMRSPMARQKFYQGWELFNRLNRADSDGAKALFEEAIALEPKSPFGYAMLAWAHYLDMERGWSPSAAKSRDLIEKYAEQALTHGDLSGVGPLVTSYLSLLDGDYDDALATSAKVIEQRPSCPGAFSMRAGILNYSGNAREAVEPAHKALRLSPVVQPVYPEMLSLAYYLDHQLDLALETANDTLSFAPDSIEARVILAAALVESGRAQNARDSAMDILTLDPSFALERYESTHPFRHVETLHRITGALRQAGLQDERDVARRHGLASESRRRLTPQRKH